MHYIYILYSASYQRYYIGETEDVSIRLQQHNTGYFKSSSTAFTNDWQLKLTFKVKDRIDARKVEGYIKSMKSKKFIEQLIMEEEFRNTFKEIVHTKYAIQLDC